MVYTDITRGVSDTLVMLWKKRDLALSYEKNKNIEPRTSHKFMKAQEDLDNYFLPKKKKAQRKKPKKKPMPDNEWEY